MGDSTIRISPHAIFWVVALALITLGLFIFYQILLPFVLGIALAYFFHPVVDGLHRIGIPRGLSAFVMIAIASVLAIAIFSLIIPPLVDQLTQFGRDLPGYLGQARAYFDEHAPSFLKPAQQPIAGGDAQQADMQRQIAQNLAPWIAAQFKPLVSGGIALFTSIALLVITPVVTFFMLRDWDKMVAGLDRMLPRQDAPIIRALAKEIDSTISAYLRGTLIVLIVVSAYYMTALGLIGLNYGLLIGLGAGLISFIPYFGSTTGFFVAGGVAVAQFWPDYSKIALVLAIFVSGQIVEGNVLTPNIVGPKVRLHPVWLLFALVASGYLLGFTGLLISVPLAAAVGVIVRYALRRYYNSDLYRAPADSTAKSAPQV